LIVIAHREAVARGIELECRYRPIEFEDGWHGHQGIGLSESGASGLARPPAASVRPKLHPRIGDRKARGLRKT
jgi:hypothetical protein